MHDHDETPVTDVAGALEAFVSDLVDIRDELVEKTQRNEERLSMLHQHVKNTRPPLAQKAETDMPHKNAFSAYLRNGDDEGLRGLDLQGKSMNTTIAADGGYLVDPQTSETVRTILNATASLRQISNVVEVEATSYDILIDSSDIGAGWASETEALSETGAPTFERIVIALHELSALPKASQRLLDDTAFDLEAWLAGRIADKFTRAEGAAFINGSGTNQPKGFLTYPKTTQDAWNWGTLGYIAGGSDAGIDSAEPLIDLVYALGARYRANGSFVLNSKTAGSLRKLKDADGRFLWADGLASGEPARLLGYPVLVAEDMPDIGADNFPVAFGDFAAGYTVAERPDLRILRDPFSAKPNVLFYATKRVGGDVSDFAAIKLLKCALS